MNETKFTIKTWKQFAKRVRPKGCGLLKRLDSFPDSILVTGCQRSGTTILSRVITLSDGMVNYWFGKDDELDAALILSGEVNHQPSGRYCFQTTYLNECYKEYFEHDGKFKMIWVVRNPYSVVYSLMYHWRRWTLNELFKACGSSLLEGRWAERYNRFGIIGVPRIIRACLSYNGKTTQLFDLAGNLSSHSVLAVDYDDLVSDPEMQFTKIFKFIGLNFQKRYIDPIHRKSTHKKDRLSEKEREIVSNICHPVYERAKLHLDKSASQHGK